MNKNKKNKQNSYMKTKYKINKNELVLDITFLYEVKNSFKKLKNIYNYLNYLLENEIEFQGNKIIIYVNGILIGTFYLTSFYLRKINFKNNNLLSENNSYFVPSILTEINPHKYYKLKKIINV